MADKLAYEELEKKIKELEHDNDKKASQIEFLREKLKKVKSQSTEILSKMEKIQVSSINIEWDTRMGTCSFENLPVAMMWVDTTLAGLMSGVQAMVGAERFGLALQSEGRKSVEDDWKIISQYSDFEEGFKAIANIAAVAGWGDWKLIFFDKKKKECKFHVQYSWEGLYQKTLGVCWGSGMLAGKMAGYCSKLFGTNCWADQTAYIAKGDPYDEFVVRPSPRSVENEIESLLVSDEATRADMAIALQKLEKDITERKRMEKALRKSKERYRNILESIEEGYYEVDLAGNFTFFNDSICGILGYTRGELMGMNDRRYTDPENAKKLFKAFNKVYETEKPTKEFDWEVIRKDGTRRFVEASVSLIKEDEDHPTGFRGIVRDVTERKKAEESLRQETEFRRVLGAIANEFITASPTSIDDSIDRALQTIGNFVGADRSYVIRFDFQAGKINNTHEWCREGIEPQIENLHDLTINKFSWVIDQLAALKVVHIPKVADLPKEGNLEKEEFEAEGIKSLLLVPLVSDGRCIGTVGFDFVIQERFCSEIEIRLLQMSGATLSNALDRKRAEEALKESEEKYKNLFDDAPVGYMEYDIKGRITKVNRRESEMLGYTAEEILGEPAWHFVTEKEKGEKLIKAKLAGNWPGSKNLDRTYIRKDGSTFPVLINDVVFKNDEGQIIAIRSTIQDISERKKAEEALRQSEEKYRELYEKSRRAEEVYRSLLHTSADAIIIYDLEGKVKYVNPIFTEIFGWTLEELEGRRLQFLPDSEKEATLSGIKIIMEHGKPIQGFETKRYTKGGQIIDVNISGSRYHDHEGNPAGMLVVLRDITEKKRLEFQLQQTKKMEAMGLLAGGVAHDLNNILSGIVSYPELLLLDLPQESPLRKPIKTIQESGNRATAIVQDLLTIARGVASAREPLNLNDLVTDYLDSPEFKKLQQFHPAVTVKTNLETELFNIGGSLIHIRKVIMNLVSNAAEAIEGSGTVTISTTSRYIDRPIGGYEYIKKGEYSVLVVSDDGSGIGADDLERIFEPFYTKKVMGRSGTGLGLAVVWNVIKDHKGYIDVKSDRNGTTFELYFPISRDEISDKTRVISLEDYKGNGETILVVDDVESQREISCRMLETLGYNSEAVSSGEEAVEYLQENTVDLISLDMIMDPGINGRETYERIVMIHPNQKAIIVSGFVETEDVKEVQKLGAGRYIKKPLTLEKIGLAVKEELSK